MTPRPQRVALAGLALALTVAACASGDTDDSATGTVVGSEPTVTSPTAIETEPTDTSAGTDPGASVTDPGMADPPDTTAPAVPEIVVPEALQFTAPLVGGGEFDGAAVADKPTVFWFWAPT
jgi:hypothetical protein